MEMETRFDMSVNSSKQVRPEWLGTILGLIHGHFLGILLASYAIATIWPGPGLVLRSVSLGELRGFGESMRVSLPTIMLGYLLFCAGLGVDLGALGQLVRRPRLLVAGLSANLIVPLGFILIVSQAAHVWNHNDELQNILIGLALVASMPIAGSSTAWSQNADGDVAVSLGMVVGSTLASPLSTPLVLHAVGWMAQGGYARELHALAAHGTGLFLGICVIAPSLLGMALRRWLGGERVGRLMPWLKLVSSIDLVLLCYSNAAISLPQAIAHPDIDFLAVIVTVTVALCVLTFGAGWLIGRMVGASASQSTALMFALGMNNNGTGLVLASMTLAGYPRVLLPIIFYNLVQQIVAGLAGTFRHRRDRGQGSRLTTLLIGRSRRVVPALCTETR